ncbi:hypothetical protein ACFDTO_01970 [Microbacteriaceae bacterium 4G12]
MPMLCSRPAVVLLAAILLLCGCTAPTPDATPSPSPDNGTAAPTPYRVPPRDPVTGTAPPTSPTTQGFDFVTVDDDGYGLAPAAETQRAVITWAGQYCELANLTPCTGIGNRGVPLCIERRDCHPALLVPFREGTAAFVSGGIFPKPRVFAVWRPEGDPAVAQYGGAQAILEAYLLTVGVCRDEPDGDPRGRDCPPFSP